MRTEKAIAAQEHKFFELVWYDRHQSGLAKQRAGNGGHDVRHTLGEEAARRIEAQYPPGELGPHTDFEWGLLNGKLSALRWVLGGNWDELDT